MATVQVGAQGEITEKITREVKTFTEDLGYGVTLEMVCVPGASFWMGKTTITRSQWQASSWLQENRQASQVASPQDRLNELTLPHRPVDNVHWTEAVEYCQWLSQRTGRAYQLPSAAQWEYACRARTTTSFYVGEVITPALANCRASDKAVGKAVSKASNSEYCQQTTDVASFVPNAFGLYDMHGNVWEWCLENGSTAEEPTRQLSAQKKCLKGGSWNCEPDSCRADYCLNYPFPVGVDAIGFRVICG